MKTIKMMLMLIGLISVLASCNRTERLYRIQDKGKYGFIDSIGNIKIQPQYKYVGHFSTDGYAVVISKAEITSNNHLKLTYGYIDKKNHIVIDTTNVLEIDSTYKCYWEVGEIQKKFVAKFNESDLEFLDDPFPELDLCDNRYLFQDPKNHKIGYKNIKGDIVVKPIYVYARSFDGGVAFVRKDITLSSSYFSKEKVYDNINKAMNGFCLIDVNGSHISENDWFKISDFDHSGKSWVATIAVDKAHANLDWTQIDRHGKILIGPIAGIGTLGRVLNNYYSDMGIYIYMINSMVGTKYSFINKDGKFITDRNGDGMLSIYGNNSECFDDVTQFSSGYAGVRVYKNDGQSMWVFMNKNLKFVSEPYDSIKSFREGLAAIQEHTTEIAHLGLWGFVDTTFNVVIPYKFSKVSSFSHGLAYAVIQGATFNREGLINRKGEFVWETKRKMHL